MSALIAIVGRPNVGKSALFNRIIKKRVAIVHDEPGVTRDRISVEAEYKGYPYTLMDTGGIGLRRGEKAKNVIEQAALDQVELAIEAAHVIIFVVNVQEGIVPLDEEVGLRLRQSRKPILIAVNKVDNFKSEAGLTEFSALGFDEIFPVTAIHGLGLENLMDAAFKHLPPLPANTSPQMHDGYEEQETSEEEPEKPRLIMGKTRPVNIAIVGRPNVGKSSIINAMTNSKRVIVSPIAGTTRDSIDVPFEVETDGVRQQYILIDTAGVRQEKRIDDSVEFYSVKRTDESIAKSDITVLVVDAEHGITAQDKKIAGKIQEERRACIIVVNKWDLVKGVTEARKKEIEDRQTRVRDDITKRLTTLSEFGTWVQGQLFFMDYAPVIFTSATSGFHLDRLLEAIRYVASQLVQKIPTAILNRTINFAIEQRQPVSAGGHRLKFYYATQVRESPPTFLLFVNKDELFSEQYNKYLGAEIRKAFGYEGCPIILVPKARTKTIEPKRKFAKAEMKPVRYDNQKDPKDRAKRRA
ncbi:MAG: der [Verrucomicrobiales bacterium]|nr:der [Verrucomicrobiales bacterium]